MDDRELMQQALDAQEKILRAVSIMNDGPDASDVNHAEDLMTDGVVSMQKLRTALHKRLAQPDPEPCQHEWVCTGAMPQNEARCVKCGMWKSEEKSEPVAELTCVCGAVWQGEEMVCAPPRREWQGLTDEDLTVCDEDGVLLARYWEAKLKEKNNG